MNKTLQYLRITKDWAQVVNKDNTPAFIANTSGTPVEFFLYGAYLPSINPESLKVKTYIAGGSIGQICVDNMYLYARSLTDNEDDVTTVVISDKPVGDVDVEEQTSQIDTLLVEIMKITQRLNETQQRISRNDFTYYKLLRYIVDNSNAVNTIINNLSTRVVNLYTKLFAVETFIAQNKVALFSLKHRVQAIEEQISKIGFDGLAGKINEILLQLGDINAAIEIIMPIIEDSNNLVSGALTPVKLSLSAINNSIATLAVTYGDTEIYQARDKLLQEYSEVAPESISLIRNFAELVIDVGHKLDISTNANDMLVLNTDSLTDLEPTLPSHN